MQCEKCIYSENKMCGYGKKPKKAISIEVEVEMGNEMEMEDEVSPEMDMIHKLAMVMAEDNKCPFYEASLDMDEDEDNEQMMIPVQWL